MTLTEHLQQVGTWTPGPWTVTTRLTAGPRCWIDAPDGPLATVYVGSREEVSPHDPTFKRIVQTRSNDEVEANAHLVAAAPELLVALKKFCDGYDLNTDCESTTMNEAYLLAMDAIAKAESRS